MEVINEEIQTILRNGPLASDIDKEKASMIKDHEQNLRDNDWWQSAIYRFYRYGENIKDEYISALQTVTQESVRKTLQALIDADTRIEVVMLPE